MTMIGPVLYQEIVLGARRTRLYAFRWVYAGWMLVTLLWLAFVAWFTTGFFMLRQDPFFTENACAKFSLALVVQQFLRSLIATPAIVAGSITDEKRNNTLLDLLATH